MTPRRDAALRIAARGLRVFPLQAGGTKPIVKFSETSTSDPDQITKVWRSDSSRKNIGVHTGGGVFVVDVDAQSGGGESLDALEAKHGDLPDTYTVDTPSGGYHLYFSTDADVRNSASKIGPGIDIRGHNGYVVGEGSIREATDKKPGGEYTVCDDSPIAEAPPWLVELCTAQRSNLEDSNTLADSSEPLEDVPAGNRNDRLFREACSLRAQGWVRNAIRDAISARNQSFTEPLPAAEVATIAAQAAKYPIGTAKARYDDLMAGKVVKINGKRPNSAEFGIKVLDCVDIAPVEFLWNGMFPLSSLSMVAGDPGQSKTTFMLSVAAGITQGRSPVKGSKEKLVRGSVLLATAEDSLRHTIAPRFKAAGGDLSKLIALTKPDLSFADDYDQLAQTCHDLGDVRMLLIDPITAYMGRGADSNSNSDVRRTASAITDLAEEFDLAAVTISHLNKDSSKTIYARLLGSIGWLAAPRAVYMIGPDPEQPNHSVVACIKTNFLKPDPIGFHLELAQLRTKAGEIIEQVYAVIGDYTGSATLDDIFKPRTARVSKVDDAVIWLNTELATHAWIAAQDLINRAKKGNICSERTLRAAKARMAVETRKKGNRWYWRLDAPDLPKNPTDGLAAVESARHH